MKIIKPSDQTIYRQHCEQCGCVFEHTKSEAPLSWTGMSRTVKCPSCGSVEQAAMNQSGKVKKAI